MAANKYLDLTGLTRYDGKIKDFTAGRLAVEFSSSSTYVLGAYVTHNGKLYRCTTAVTTAGQWADSNWTEVRVMPEIETKLTNKANATDLGTLTGSIADQYNPAALQTYSVGDYVIKDYVLYRCTAATSGAWDSSKWTAVQTMEEVAGLASTLTGALKFVGISSTDPSASGGATVSGHTTWKKGDVVLYKRSGESNYEEYLATQDDNAHWELLGDADSYALKTVSIFAGTGLTGGGTLAEDRTISANLSSTDPIGTIGTTDKVYSVGVDTTGKLAVYIPWEANTHYTNYLNLKTKVGDTETSVVEYTQNSDKTLKFIQGSNITLTPDATNGTITIAATANSNQKIKVGSTTFGDNDVINLVEGSNVTLTAATTGDGAPKITIASTDTNYYPTTFTWTNGTTAGPTGSLSGVGMTNVAFGAIPSASDTQSGIVTTSTQTFTGIKNFKNSIIVPGISGSAASGAAGLTFSGTNSIDASLSGSGIMELSSSSNNVVIGTGSSSKAYYYKGTIPSEMVANNEIATKGDIPTGFTITANATDGIFDLTGTNGTNSVTYALTPYDSTTATSTWVGNDNNAGKFYLGTQAPSKTTRLNYNGYLYAKKLYSDGNAVLTASDFTAITTSEIDSLFTA